MYKIILDDFSHNKYRLMIFFPNAPYILTDFQHLAGQRTDLPVRYDVMRLIWFAFTGLLPGMVSLFLMQEIIRREFGRWVGWGFVTLEAAFFAEHPVGAAGDGGWSKEN